MMYGGLKQCAKKSDGIWEILLRQPLPLRKTKKCSHIPQETLKGAPALSQWPLFEQETADETNQQAGSWSHATTLY